MANSETIKEARGYLVKTLACMAKIDIQKGVSSDTIFTSIKSFYGSDILNLVKAKLKQLKVTI